MTVRNVGLFTLGLMTPYALLFALETLHRGNAPWEWLWSLAFAGLWVLARPHHKVVSYALFWTAAFFFTGLFPLEGETGKLTPSQVDFYKFWFTQVTLFAVVLGVVTAIAGAIYEHFAWWQWRKSIRP